MFQILKYIPVDEPSEVTNESEKIETAVPETPSPVAENIVTDDPLKHGNIIFLFRVHISNTIKVFVF